MVIITRRYYALAHNTPQVYILIKIFVHFQNILLKKKIVEALFVKERSTLSTKSLWKNIEASAPEALPQEEQLKSKTS